MTQKFYAIVTNLGAAKIANAVSLGTKLNITHMAVGDGGGTLPTPNAAQTKLVNEVRRAALNSLTVDTANSSQIIAEQVIPETEGGFWIREMGLFDADGSLIAVCNTAETYKPQLQEGSGRTQRLRMLIIVSSTEAVTLKVDPSVVLATRQYVDEKVLEVRQYADSLMTAHLKAADPHTQYAPKESPVLTGIPKAPTAAAGNSSTQLATTAFVQAALSALAGGAPAALDTLKELADALGGDANFSTTVLNKLAGKMDIARNGSDIANVSAFLKNLGLGDGSALPVGVPVPWPVATAPSGWLRCNGATFSASDYPQLAKAYPSLRLPDLRGEFIRGWDDGRGADPSRVLLSQQEGTVVGGYDDNEDGDFSAISSPNYAFSDPLTGGQLASIQGKTWINNSSSKVNKYDWFAYSSTRPRNVAFNYIVRAA
ncbi:phage tail protein [Pantoea sp. OXWO6B1]|uniref:phage tail protein n=1 Tax=Pantoea sp. OXWO6B1 TaxID=1835724 RepID=UPI0007C820A4|nr:phage tail protein [Pantoea sp. OXWO6B1]OAE09989.1 phage tail protein [Pantoea sp. OXWO6B1]